MQEVIRWMGDNLHLSVTSLSMFKVKKIKSSLKFLLIPDMPNNGLPITYLAQIIPRLYAKVTKKSRWQPPN